MIAYPGLGRWGRLGNQLWEMAGTAGVAYHEGDVPAFPDDWKYRHVFQVPDGVFHSPSALLSMKDVTQSYYLLHIDAPYRAYMQDMELWVDIRPRIKQWFSVSAKASLELSNRYAWMLTLPRPICGVHIRRGDYVGLPWHFPPPSIWYYLQGVERFDPRSVVVFSDDIEWCRQKLRRFDIPFLFFEGGEPSLREHEPGFEKEVPTDWHDFLALSACDSFVLSNSTFGWWAAYLSGSDDVMYPTPWYGEAFPTIDASLMFSYLPKWVQSAY